MEWIKKASIAVFLLSLCASGCTPGTEDSAPAATAADQPVAAQGLPPRLPPEVLRLDGEPDLVLAEGKHGIRLTLAEYNARVDEVPLPVDSDTMQARWNTLQRLVDLKIVAAEARVRGYYATDARDSRQEERQLVRQINEKGMLGAQMTPAADARAYVAAHPEKFPDATPELLEDLAYLNHVKFTMYNDRWLEDVARWSVREEVVVHRDRFAALQPGESSRTPEQGSEP